MGDVSKRSQCWWQSGLSKRFRDFQCHAPSQAIAWSEATLASYLEDLAEAQKRAETVDRKISLDDGVYRAAGI